MPNSPRLDAHALLAKIKRWCAQLDFAHFGVTSVRLDEHEAHLMRWLDDGMHGDMDYMSKYGAARARPQEIVADTSSIISVRMNYLAADGMREAERTLRQPDKAYIARYALGRDYHKLMRRRLQKLADHITREVGAFGYRAFVDSAPVLEKALAERAGIGWIGKHTLNLSRDAGSWYFLGELFTNLPLPTTQPARNHCGECSRCMDICPTRAIVRPYVLDARLCIAYLTIEHKSSIPVALREAIGNRIFGCDDCQLVCPWNRFAQVASNADFRVSNDLQDATLRDLFSWEEERFLKVFEGSAIRRLGHIRWLRNIAVGLGNAPSSAASLAALRARADHASPLVREHVAWGIEMQLRKTKASANASICPN